MTSQTVQPEKKRRGPKPSGIGTPVQVRLQPDDLARLDAYAARSDTPMSRPEAIRAVLRENLEPAPKATAHPKPRGPATDLVKQMDKAIKDHRSKKKAAKK